MAQINHRPKRAKTEATEEEEDEKRQNIIPTDLYEEILVRLPVNDLLNLKRVCKEWLKLISSPRFIQKHLNRSKAGCNGTQILMQLPSAIIDYNHNAASGDSICKSISYPAGFSGKSTGLLGSCDGLICLVDRRSDHKLAVFNPSTGKSEVVIGHVADFHAILCSWFGHHPSTGEYVLVIGRLVLKHHSNPHVIDVYSFSGKIKLKSMHSCFADDLMKARDIYMSREEIGTLVHGVVHWPARWVLYRNAAGNINGRGRSLYVVSAYDLQKDKLLEISPPRQSYFKLGVIDGCLFAIVRSPDNREIFELWVMKEYGVVKPWTKYTNIEGYSSCTVTSVLSPLGFFPDGDLILDFDGYANQSKLTKYNFDNKKVTILKVRREFGDNLFSSGAIVCADSLMSPAIWVE